MTNLTEYAANILSYLQRATDPNTGHFYTDIDISAPTVTGDIKVVNSTTSGKDILAVSDTNLDTPLSSVLDDLMGDDHDTLTDVVDAINAVTFAGDVAVVNSTTYGMTKVKTTPDNPTNLDCTLSSVRTAIQAISLGTINITGDLAVINSTTSGKTKVAVSTVFDNAYVSADTALKVEDINLRNAVDSAAHYLSTREAPSASGTSGSVTAPVSGGTPVALHSTIPCSEVTLQASENNTQTVLFGLTTGSCTMELAKGRDFTIAIDNVSKIYVVSTGNATQSVKWISRV